MANLDLNYFKNKLEQERAALEVELSRLARPNPLQPNDWEVKPTTSEGEENDFHDETADKLEEMDEKVEIETNLEKRWREVKRALEKIATGAYGRCEIGGEEIEPERLEADPAAPTCKKHL